MQTTLIITALMIALAAVKTCTGADWAMGTADGSWSMGTPDASYPKDGGNTQTANERANREYEIADHMIAVGFTSDEVLAWGKPDEISRVVSDRSVLESWRYKNPYASVEFKDGIVNSVFE